MELEWYRNAALEHVQGLERRLAALVADMQRPPRPDAAHLRALAEDFPRVWGDAATDIRSKTRIVRLLIEEIIAKAVTVPEPQIELLVPLQGGKHTPLVIPRNRTGHHRALHRS